MGDTNAKIVLKALIEAKQIQVLNLSKNQLTCVVGKELGQLITVC